MLPQLRQECDEAGVDARIYDGIHFRFADEAARKQGQQVARWVFENFLRPLHNDDDDRQSDDDH